MYVVCVCVFVCVRARARVCVCVRACARRTPCRLCHSARFSGDYINFNPLLSNAPKLLASRFNTHKDWDLGYSVGLQSVRFEQPVSLNTTRFGEVGGGGVAGRG